MSSSILKSAKQLERMIDMSQEHHNTKSFKQLSKYERGQIQALLDEGYTVSQIAKKLNRHRSTIYRERHRGMVEQVKKISGKKQFYKRYFAEVGQNKRDKNVRKRFHKPLSEKFHSAFFERLITTLKQKYRIHSVDTFIHAFKTEFPGIKVPCTKTVYTYIHMGLIPLKPIDLPRMVRLRKRPKVDKSKQTSRGMGTSIEERDPSVETRESFGDFEIDLVLGKQGKNEGAILTLVERKTRRMITRKLKHKTAKCVNKAMRSIFRQYGKKIFKTITADNGSEFSGLTAFESKNLKIYYAHPYSSYERGTNENHNGLLREFIPKGTSLKSLTLKELERITQCLNLRPRRILNYKTPEELFQECLTVGSSV